MGDTGKKIFCCCGITFCVLAVTIGIVLISTAIKSLSATSVGLDVADATKSLNRGQLFKGGTHTLGPFHYFVTFPTEQQSISFANATSNLQNARSKDGMALNLSISYQYRLITSLTGILDLYDSHKGEWKDYLIKLARSTLRDSASTFDVTDFVFSRSTVDTKMREDLTTAFSNANVNQENLQLLDVLFPAEYLAVISSTQEESIKITEAQNHQATQKTKYEGLLTKATQDKITIANQATAAATNEKTRYDTAINEYTYYLPNMYTTWNAMKGVHGTSTPQKLILEWLEDHALTRYLPPTPNQISTMFDS